MEKLPHEFQQIYFECKDDCERKGTHHDSPLYGPVLRREYKKCEKQCIREIKATKSILMIEHGLKIGTGRLLFDTEQSRNQ